MTARQIDGKHATLVEVLRAAAQQNADVEAYVEPATAGRPRRALTFAGLDRAADGLAGLLATHGVGPGTVVCLLLPSSIDYMVVYASVTRLGAVTSGINVRLGAAEVTSIIERTRPTVTVVDDGGAVPGGPTGTVLTRCECVAATDGPPPSAWPRLSPSDPVAVVWTSGTTGLPKGAVFDHDNLRAVAEGTDILSEAGDRRLSPLPFAHVGSMTRVWDEAVNAVTTVITPTPWRSADAVPVMEAERITVAQGVPTQWALVLAEPALATADLSSLRIAGTGASRVPAELVADMREALGVPVVVRYTSTEASLGTGTVPGDPDEAVATTVGRPVPGVSLAVAGDDGRELPTGEVGRVRMRSAAVMRGYWGGPLSGPGADGLVFDAAATAAVLSDDGWLTTGDFGFLDDEGRLHLVGRANELYIRGGYNVYPAEVESVLNGRPDIEQVAVVGVPDPVLGEIGVAFVVRAEGSEADEATLLAGIRETVRASLADYKAPDRLVVADDLPLTSMMKVDKRVLADRAALETNGAKQR
ncbi:MAG: class I adenylate-forming enzyme family protein [Acidimicrobiales bacterium]|jgi:acyl-CoA synthetase (AMP-forming)/AMP-acid ligase II